MNDKKEQPERVGTLVKTGKGRWRDLREHINHERWKQKQREKKERK